MDKEFGITSYTLLLNLIEYKTLVMRDDMDAAAVRKYPVQVTQHPQYYMIMITVVPSAMFLYYDRSCSES